MKTKSYFLYFLLAVFACNEDSPATFRSTSEYTNLKVGNYWVYEETKKDLTRETTSSYYDLVSVDGIESQRGNEYFVVSGHAIGTKYSYKLLVRDSANHLVNNHGSILLDYSISDKPLRVDVSPPHYYITSTMFKEESLTIGQNTYTDILNRKEEITFSTEPLSNLTISNDSQYAKGVGLIRQTATSVSINSHILFERKLVKWGASN